MKKRLASLALVLALCLSLLPTAVLAEETGGGVYIPNTNTVSTEQELVDAVAQGGTVTLGNDITINNTLTISQNVTIDLNGHVLKMTGENRVFNVKNGGTLTLTDSNPNAVHKFTPNTDGLWVLDETNGTKTVTGGVITGGSTGQGGGVYVSEGGTLTMTGGTIAGCRVNSQGGGVYVYGGGSFTMNGGTIAGCVADLDGGEMNGGGVYVSCGRKENKDYSLKEIARGRFTMNEGSIIDCAIKSGMGGSVFINNGTSGVEYYGLFTMNGGSISDTASNTIYNFGTFIANGGTVTNSSYCVLYNWSIVQTAQDKPGTEFSGAAVNSSNGALFDGGIFNGPVTNYDKISGGVFNGTVTNDRYGTITGGTFKSAVTNNGSITGGTFNETVTNKGTITGGTFYGEITGTPALATGSGTEADPYQISTADGLKWFRDVVNGENGQTQNTAACAELTADIVLENANWTPIGPDENNAYTGTFNGGGHTVSGLSVSNNLKYAGLFGVVTDGTIQNLTAAGNVSTDSGIAGGIVGYASNAATIENCSNHCSVTGSASTVVGGISGYNVEGAKIIDCYNVSTISAENADGSGGIVGVNSGTISNCYNVGTVSNGTNVGEIVGRNDSNGTVKNCYYLSDTSNGEAKTATEFADGTVLKLLINNRTESEHPWADKCKYLTMANRTLPVFKGQGDEHTHTAVNPNDWESDGTEHWQVCACGAVFNKADHNFTERNIAQKYLKSEATCIAGPVYYMSCTICGLSSAGTTNEATFVSGEKNHDNHAGTPGEWQSNDSQHWKEYPCCHVNVYEGPHNWDSDTVTKTATCTTAGERTFTCSVCHREKTESIGATGHQWESEWVHDATHHWHNCTRCDEKVDYAEHTGGTATCTEKGKCKVCGQLYGKENPGNHTGTEQWTTTSTIHQKKWNCCGVVTVAESAHSWTDGVCTVCSYTCVHKDDNKDHVCDYCGKTISNHTGGTAYCNAAKICDYCNKGYGDKDPANHTKLVNVPAKAATTSAEGNIEYWHCEGCDQYYKDAAAQSQIAKDETVIPKRQSSSGGSSSPSYAITVPDKTAHGSVTVSPTNATRGSTVTITVQPDSGYVLETLTVTDSKGSALQLTDKGDGKYTFVMPSGKVEVKATFQEDNSVLNAFYDVPNDAYYFAAVKWAIEKGITNGISETLFGPDQPCTRAQIVTFLWRAAGSPVVNYAMDLTDVPADAYYTEAVRWALSEGITTGTGEGTFSPDETCTRAQGVTFLHRALGKTAAAAANFTDVPADSYYAQAVAWAGEAGVTNGVSADQFAPTAPCTRAQIVTFLYRAYQG